MNTTTDKVIDAELLKSARLSQLASLIRSDWRNVYFGAAPYLDAMSSLDSIEGDFGFDSGVSIVLYFLCNANTWRGPVARQVKKELNRRVKVSKG